MTRRYRRSNRITSYNVCYTKLLRAPAAAAPAPAPVAAAPVAAPAPAPAPAPVAAAPVAAGAGAVVCPMPGTVFKIRVAVGDSYNFV